MSRTAENTKGVSGIYAAIHRASGMCYVGSSVDMHTRFRKHISDAFYRGRMNFHRAIREFGPNAFDFEVLERCEPKDLAAREAFYIVLLNSTEDGFNTIKNPAISRYGTEVSVATRIRLSIAQKNSPRTIAHCRQMALKNIGKPRPKSAEYRAKISDSLRGLSHSNATRKKMSLAKKGKKKTEAHRAAIGAANLGRRHSEETRRKMSESAKRRRQREKSTITP